MRNCSTCLYKDEDWRGSFCSYEAGTMPPWYIPALMEDAQVDNDTFEDGECECWVLKEEKCTEL